jgi:hypothetical protein
MGESRDADRICVSCKSEIPFDAAFCPDCGHDYRSPTNIQGSNKVEGVLPIVGGLAVLVAGLMEVVGGVAAMSTWSTYFDGGQSEAYWLQFVYSITFIVAGLVAIVGGWRATKSRDLAFSLASGLASFAFVGLTLGGVNLLFGASELSLAGVILIAMARGEFKS